MTFGHHMLLYRLATVALRAAEERLVQVGNDEVEIREKVPDVHHEAFHADVQPVGLGHVSQVFVHVWA